MGDDADDGERPDIPAYLAMGLVIGMRVLLSYMRLKRKARSATRAFRKALVKGGMDRESARRLADEYGQFVSLRKMIRSATGGEGIPFFGN